MQCDTDFRAGHWAHDCPPLMRCWFPVSLVLKIGFGHVSKLDAHVPYSHRGYWRHLGSEGSLTSFVLVGRESMFGRRLFHGRPFVRKEVIKLFAVELGFLGF